MTDRAELVRGWRKNLVPWARIAERLGVSVDKARIDFDPGYAEKRNEASRARRARISKGGFIERRLDAGRISDQEAAARLAEIPEDTRDLTGRLMGDPLPGRSALDKLRAQNGGKR